MGLQDEMPVREGKMKKPKMYYFGPWNSPGHHYYTEDGGAVYLQEERTIPWQPHQIDGKLQPGCYFERGRWWHKGTEKQGQALLHHKEGWTAISFWDRSVDARGGCNSTYVAEGEFTFEQMVEMAKSRFAYRWNKMPFIVVPAE
jgi:hypothetical protein